MSSASRDPASRVPVVILAGGRGARFDHESQVRPKPLIEVAGKPILGHIMDLFEAQGFDDFIVLGGFKVDMIADYLATRYECRANPPRYDHITVFGNKGQPVKAHLFDTGEDASTGSRLYSLLLDFMPREARFFLTYGDGLADVDLRALLTFHNDICETTAMGDVHATVTAVRPPGRFGVMRIGNDGAVYDFIEKSSDDWINGGFMVLDRGVVAQYVPNHKLDQGLHEMESFEAGALPRMAKGGNLFAFEHTGYWRCMDTRRDLEQIEADVASAGGRLPWRRDMMQGGEK